MDFNRVINQAISRTVNKCYAEEESITLPQSNWSFTPLIPPGCVPFLELYGLENVVDTVLAKITSGMDWEDVTSDDGGSNEHYDLPNIAHPECILCQRDFAPGWIKIQNGVVCSPCAKSKTRIGFTNSNRVRLGRVLDKVSNEIKIIETSASERLSQIDEMRVKKRKLQENCVNFERNKVIFPSFIKELFENNITAERKREMLRKASAEILNSLRDSQIQNSSVPPLTAKIDTLQDLLSHCK